MSVKVNQRSKNHRFGLDVRVGARTGGTHQRVRYEQPSGPHPLQGWWEEEEGWWFVTWAFEAHESNRQKKSKCGSHTLPQSPTPQPQTLTETRSPKLYWVTSLVMNSAPLGPQRRTMTMALWRT